MDVSIVVINKDKENSIRECIEAIVKQKRDTDELIVVDDSSTDSSMQCIREWKDSINNIVSIESHGNRSKVRNDAVHLCTKEIIVFVDSDVIIGPHNIEVIRKTHQDKEVVGTNGNVCGNAHDIAQFEFVTGLKLNDFICEVKKNFDVIYEYESFFDHRYKNPGMTSDEWDNWENYYTSCASVRRDVYEKVGGFDEGIVGWGGEDSEFGYRINKLGRIVFDEDIVSFHVPHSKNLYNNFRSFLRNMFYFLGKYQNMDYEIYSSFLTDDKKRVKKELTRLQRYIIEQSQRNTEFIDIRKNEIYVMLCDELNSNGRINYFKENVMGSISLMGFAIPLADKSVDNAYISSKCHMLPIALECKLFQESLRVSKNVFLKKNSYGYQRYDDKGVFDNDYRMMLGVYYVSESITDFEIVDYDEEFYRISWKANADMLLSKAVLEL